MIVRPFSVLTSFTAQDSLPIGASVGRILINETKNCLRECQSEVDGNRRLILHERSKHKAELSPCFSSFAKFTNTQNFSDKSELFCTPFYQFFEKQTEKKKCKSYRWLSCLKIPLKRLQWKVGVSYSLQSSRWKYFWQRGSDAKYVRFISKRHLKK